MSELSDIFQRHVSQPDADPEVLGLRHSLTEAKRRAVTQADGLDDEELKQVLPDLYLEIIGSNIQLAAHLGLAVGMAVNCIDEQTSGVSISSFGRQMRQLMTEMGVQLKKRHGSKVGKLVAEIEAQRLAWRHNHEFLSWLAFRRGDDRYPAADRRARLDAFKVQERLLQSREGISRYLGATLCAAIEGHDRFLLTNRWRLESNDETSVERRAWPILSLQPGHTVLIEQARYEHDALMSMEAPPQDAVEGANAVVRDLLIAQFTVGLELPTATATLGRVI
jgi:hypothetical protein